MPEQLQHLLQRIRTEAVDQAEQEAGEILESAKRKAAGLVRDAEEQAKAALERADRDARQYTERSRRALDQAARDLLISVGNGVQKILQEVIVSEASAEMKGDFLQRVLDQVISAYATGDASGPVDILAGPGHVDALRVYFQAKLKDRLTGGGRVVLEEGMGAGFKVYLQDGHVAHDFSAEAVADALGALLQPHLAEIVRRAAQPPEADG